MSVSTFRVGESFSFALPDAGASGETRTAADLAGSHDYVVAVLLRDHYCPRSRLVVQSLAGASETFGDRSAAVVPVLPERRERASIWRRRYDLPFGLLIDPPEGEDGREFGTFEPFRRLLPERPGAVLFDADGDRLRFVRTVPFDEGRPVDAVVEAVDDQTVDGPVEPAGFASGSEAVGDTLERH